MSCGRVPLISGIVVIEVSVCDGKTRRQIPSVVRSDVVLQVFPVTSKKLVVVVGEMVKRVDDVGAEACDKPADFTQREW